MNVIRPPEYYDPPTPDAPPFAWVPLFAAFLRRNGSLIATCVIGSLIAGAALILLATPKYTALAEVLIDPRQGVAFQQQAPSSADALSDNAVVESQVEVLRSDGAARHVATTLHLAHDSTFMSWGYSLPRAILGRVLSLIEPRVTRPDLPGDSDSRAVELLRTMASVRRIGLSNVIEVAVQTPSPGRSAQLANALASTYIDDTLQARYAVTRRASTWLEDRLGELRDQSRSADAALAEERARIGLVDTDKGGLNEQALGDLTTQLGIARGRSAETAARYSRIQAVTAAGLVQPGTVVDALANTVILKLQTQYLETARREAEWTTRFGARHAAVAAARREAAALQASIASELRQIQESYRSDEAVARAQEADLQARMTSLIAVSTAANGGRAQIRALESVAETYRVLYASFLQRYTQAAQDQSFPISQARIVSAAVPPLRRSSPPTPIVMLGAAVLGLGGGLAAGLAREAMDRRVRTARQAHALTGLDCLGILPRIRPLRGPAASGPLAAVAGSPGVHEMARLPALLRLAVDSPLSPFSEGIRGISARLVPGPLGLVAGVLSALPGEGRSVVAANLALLLAARGHRTVLIDCDFRKPDLSLQMAPAATLGFSNAARAPALLQTMLWRDVQTGLAFLPAHRDHDAHPADALASPGAAALIAALRAQYTFIVIDLPPLSCTADMQAAAGLCDSFILVNDAATTPQHDLIAALDGFTPGASQLLGIVLNRAGLPATLRVLPDGRALPFTATSQRS